MTKFLHQSRFLLGALGLSLLFNVFVLVGFVQTRASNQRAGIENPAGAWTEPDEAVVNRVTNDLRLNDVQRSTFAELHSKQRAQAQIFDGSLAIIHQDISDELGKDNPDPQRLRTLVGQEADLIREKRMAGAELMGKFIDVLTPEQRKLFGRRAGLLPPPGPEGPGGPRPPGPGAGVGAPPGAPDPGHPGLGAGPGGRDRDNRRGDRRFNPGPDIMRRFDLNHNGRLDPDEMQAARQELEARRREFAPGERRPGGPPPQNPGGPREVIEAFGPGVVIPLWRWFDQDGDGQLNDAERDSLREFTGTHQTPQRPQRDRDLPPPPQDVPDDENPGPPPQN